MTIEIGRYQFHSWTRKGISANITEVDDLGRGTSTTKERAEVSISVKLNHDAVSKDFSLIGPGDIIGINSNMIIRTDPVDWVTDTEPNYLAIVEFYDEDFPWRYTPAAARGEKLRPWIVLLVLEADEFEDSDIKMPLPVINISGKNVFPPHKETWLWAHVHSNADIPDAELSNYERFLLSLNQTTNDDPDQLFSRLMSPRKLKPNTAYHAFVVPAFEAGRLAGLGESTDDVAAQTPSWDKNGARGPMPVYYKWYFRTGSNVDFESLVNLLESRVMDKKVGIRDMDCSAPGFVKADGSAPVSGTSPSLIGLEGALKSPYTVSTVFPEPSAERDFQVDLQGIVNLPETIPANLLEDPIISLPMYGKNHAKKSLDEKVLLDIDNDSWVHEINKDPRTRVAAGLGTLVVQTNQEKYMQKAWGQVKKIIEANRRIIFTQFFMTVSYQYTKKIFGKLKGAELLGVSNTVLKKIKGSPATIYHMMGVSRLPRAAVSGAFRRMVRPGGPIARKLGAQTHFNYNRLIDGLNDGKVTASPAREIPSGLFTTKDISDTLSPDKLPPWLLWLLDYADLLMPALLLLFIILIPLTGHYVIFSIVAVATAVLYPAIRMKRGQRRADAGASESILDNQMQLDEIRSIPPRPDFSIDLSDRAQRPAPTATDSGEDSVEAKNFRKALIGLNKRLAIKAPVKEPVKFDLANAYAKVSDAIDPHKSFPSRLVSIVRFPSYIQLDKPEKIFPAMAYPDFEDPMYKSLSDISSELLLPNLDLIPPNTVSLLETNPKFIESHMVGLNHEMGSELLWREYPTDKRGSYFRQFWDVKGVISPTGDKTEAELTEEYKDIKPIHTWRRDSRLGEHDNRINDSGPRVVMVVRADLLKRYPNTLIFAQKAIANQQGGPEPKIEMDLNDREFKRHVRFPLYKAEIEPDLKFFGFDLTVAQAKGDELTPGFDDDLGWFFIIQEIPGEPRFGMDKKYAPGSDGITWDDLSWENFEAPETMRFIESAKAPRSTFVPTDNVPSKWGTDSANMAYILFQKPSMLAVHATEMLGGLTGA